MGLAALQELPCSLLLFEERMRLSNTLWTSKKAQGAGIPDGPGFALGVVKKNKHIHGQYAGNDPLDRLFGEFVEGKKLRWGISCCSLLPPPRFTASQRAARDLEPTDPRVAARRGFAGEGTLPLLGFHCDQ